MTQTSTPYEALVSVKFTPSDRCFDIAVPVGRQPAGPEGGEARSRTMRLDFDKFVNPDVALLQMMGRFVQASVLARMIDEGISGLDARAISEAIGKKGPASRADEEFVASVLRRVIVSRMVGMTHADEPCSYSLADFPKLFDAALLFGGEDMLRLKQRWPRIRRVVAALSVERDLEKRVPLLRKLALLLKK